MRRVLEQLHRVETLGIAVLSLLLLVLPLSETISRPLGITLDISAAHLPHVVVWLTLLGGLVAVRRREHLRLATMDLWRKGRIRTAAQLLGAGLGAAIVIALAWASLDMVVQSHAEQRALPVGLPLWVAEAMIPTCLGLIAFRLLFHAGATWTFRAIAGGITAAILAGCAGLGVAKAALWPLVCVVIGGAVIGAPIFTAMAGIAMLLYHTAQVSLVAVPLEVTLLLQQHHLAAIPMLTICGYLLAETRAAERLVRFFRATLGWLPGGLAILVACICAVFTALTGGSGVTIIALGGLTLTMLRKDGYSEPFALGHVTASSSLGLLFPPSLPVIIYAVVVTFSGKELGMPELDPKTLYLAGLLPGILMLAMVASYGVWVGRKSERPRDPFSWEELRAATWEAKWELSIPVVIIGLFFAVGMPIVEVASIAALYTLIVEVWITRDLHWLRDLPGVLVKAGALVGAILLLLGTAKALSQYCIEIAELHKTLLVWVTANVDSKLGFLLGLNLLLLFLGSILEVYSALAILPPLLAPIAFYYDVDPVHMAIIFLANIELGFLTPPVGLNLFLAAARFEQPVFKLYRFIVPYLAIMVVSVLVITYVPALSVGVVEATDPDHRANIEEKRAAFKKKMADAFGPNPEEEKRLEKETETWGSDLHLDSTEEAPSWAPPKEGGSSEDKSLEDEFDEL